MQRYLKAIVSLDSLIKPSNGKAATIGAFIAPLAERLSGSGHFWAYALFFSIVVADWISGTEAARKTGTYKSEYGHSGVLRTILMLWIPFIGWLLDKVSAEVFGIHEPGIAYYGITFALAFHSWVSMTANSYRAGWGRWIPKKVLNFVASEIKAKAERAFSMQNVTGKN
ncbi:hypothetical protein SD71_16300 [Cohnella kolymensis]|uniref:Holin n=1 Tax=Cohnella kolymensis TaxID=1590652 RepID=A0ABR5A3B3_9BACL|nr:phage holin family protein [Cohnella kolymensis]KIL35183.1 hypothetical protein SD71_16300 [Cohnella kolymensis]